MNEWRKAVGLISEDHEHRQAVNRNAHQALRKADLRSRIEELRGCLNAHRQNWITYDSDQLKDMQAERRELESKLAELGETYPTEP